MKRSVRILLFLLLPVMMRNYKMFFNIDILVGKRTDVLLMQKDTDSLVLLFLTFCDQMYWSTQVI